MDFVSKVMPLVFNMLPRLVIAFLPRSKCLLFMAAVTICSDFRAQGNKEELKSLFMMKVKEESEKAGLKLNIQKTKIMASSPINSWQIDW